MHSSIDRPLRDGAEWYSRRSGRVVVLGTVLTVAAATLIVMLRKDAGADLLFRWLPPTILLGGGACTVLVAAALSSGDNGTSPGVESATLGADRGTIRAGEGGQGLAAQAIQSLSDTGEGLLVVDGAGRVLATSAVARRLFNLEGAAPCHQWSQIHGVHLDETGSPCPAQRHPLLRALRGENVDGEEYFVRNPRVPEGMWIRASARPVRDAAGTVCGAAMMFHDVTRRRRSITHLQDQLARLKQEYRHQYSLAEVELAINEPGELQTVLERVKEHAKRLVGSSRALIALASPSELRRMAHVEQSPAPRLRPDDGAAAWILEHRRPLSVSRIEDDPFPVHRDMDEFRGVQAWAGVPLIADDLAVGVLYVFDEEPRSYTQDDLDVIASLASRAAAAIAKVRLYEHLRGLNAELSEKERRFRMLADNAPVMIWMCDAEERSTYFNRAWLEFTGRQPLIGNHWADVGVHPEDLELTRQMFQNAFAARERFQLEYRILAAEGRYRWVVDTGIPRFRHDGAFLGYIGSCQDITIHRETAAELEELVRERTEKLEASHQRLRIAERLASLGTLAAGLGHDMNNVLFPMRFRLDAVDRNALNDDLRELLDAVSHSVEYLQQLTDGLRLFALDPDDPRASAEVTSLPEWWPKVSALLLQNIPDNVVFEVELDPELPCVRVPAHRLTQAVFNLVGNACEAMPEGGRLRVWAEVIQGGATVRLGVSDTGSGMSEEVRRRAIDPFFTTKTRRRATGLGLSLVHGVTSAAHGHLDIKSVPGGGTTVLLEFPAATEVPADPAAAGDPTAVAGATAMVGLADQRTASWMSDLLRRVGYEVVPSQGEPHDCRLWITDASAAALERARRFLESGARRQVIVFGGAGADWERLPARIIEDAADLNSMRQAVQEAVLDDMGAES